MTASKNQQWLQVPEVQRPDPYWLEKPASKWPSDGRGTQTAQQGPRTRGHELESSTPQQLMRQPDQGATGAWQGKREPTSLNCKHAAHNLQGANILGTSQCGGPDGARGDDEVNAELLRRILDYRDIAALHVGLCT